MPAQVTGRARITISGTTYQTKEGARLDPGGVTRETVNSDQDTNYAEKLRQSKLTCDILWTAGLDLIALNDIKNATVVFEADTGDTYVIQRCWRPGEMEATSGASGGVPITLEGPAATRVTAGA